MNWLQKTSQAKPMALPFARPETYEQGQVARGLDLIDEEMDQQTADAEKLRLNPEYLGSGGMGLAGITPEGLVVKWTREEDEAAIAEAFVNNDIPCLPKVYEVKQLQKFLWAITMEKVDTIPYSEEGRALITVIRYMLYDPQEDFEGHHQTYKAIIAKNPELQQLAEDYNNMVSCLEKNGVVPGDAHSGNIGYNSQGMLVLFDLGLSNLVESSG